MLATIFALNWAKPILVPILLGVMFSYALTPVVDTLHRWRMPRALGASVVLSAILVFLGWGAWALSDDATALIATLPQVAQKVRRGLEGQQKNAAGSPIEKVQQAANELEQAAQRPRRRVGTRRIERIGAAAARHARPRPPRRRPPPCRRHRRRAA